MEKIDLLIWDDTAAAAAKSLDVPGLRSLQVSVAADLAGATLLLGKGPTLRGYAEIWVDSVDVWPDLVEQVPGDAYLVTESVPQAVQPGELLTHFSWFPKPDRLSEEEFFHGWHTIHTPSSARLHPHAPGLRPGRRGAHPDPGVTAGPAIVSEFFAEDDYLDPARLFAPDELTTDDRGAAALRRPGGRVEPRSGASSR